MIKAEVNEREDKIIEKNNEIKDWIRALSMRANHTTSRRKQGGNYADIG